MLVGMLSLSAKTVNLSAFQSPSVSSQDPNPIAAFSCRLQFVGIVVSFGDPQPAALVPSHAIGLPPDLGFGGEQFDAKILRGTEMCFIDSSGCQRLLHLREVFALRAPFVRWACSWGSCRRRRCTQTVSSPRQARRHVGDGERHIGQVIGHLPDVVTGGPANAAFDQILKTWFPQVR